MASPPPDMTPEERQAFQTALETIDLPEPATAGPGAELLVGKMVSRVRPMTAEEQLELYWSERGIVIEFEDGTVLYAAQDEEQNGPGTICGYYPDGYPFGLFTTSEGLIGLML